MDIDRNASSSRPGLVTGNLHFCFSDIHLKRALAFLCSPLAFSFPPARWLVLCELGLFSYCLQVVSSFPCSSFKKGFLLYVSLSSSPPTRFEIHHTISVKAGLQRA